MLLTRSNARQLRAEKPRHLEDDYVAIEEKPPYPVIKLPPATPAKLAALAERFTNPVRFTPKERYMNTARNEQLSLDEQLDEAAGATGRRNDDDTQDNTYEAPTYEVGAQVFDLLEDPNTDLDSAAQRVAWRSIGNSALYVALMGINFWIEIEGKENVDPDKIDEAHRRASLYAGIYARAKDECLTLRTSEYDEVMEPEAMFDFITKGEPREYDRDAAMFDALLPTLGLDEAGQLAIRTERKQALKREAVKQHTTLIARREAILSEFHSIDLHFAPEQLTAIQHLRFIEKVQQKLKDAARRAMVNIGRYPDAPTDVATFTAAATVIDRFGMAFRRRNKDDLRDALQRS